MMKKHYKLLYKVIRHIGTFLGIILLGIAVLFAFRP